MHTVAGTAQKKREAERKKREAIKSNLETMKKLIILIAVLCISFASCEKEQTLIKIESKIEYKAFVELRYYKISDNLTKINLISFYI